MNDTGHQERRRNERVPFTQEIEVIGSGMFQSVEFSIGGMYLKTREPYAVGALLDLQFKLSKSDEHPIVVQACVLYSHKNVGMGLGFLGLKLEDLKKIEKFIEEV